MKLLSLLLAASLPLVICAQHVGIGTNSPTAPLDVNGTVRIRGGNPAEGAVLTSDANGNASWQSKSQPSLGAGLAAFQVLPKSSLEKVKFVVSTGYDESHVQFNTFGSAYNNTTHEFTVPDNGGGLYEVNTSLVIGVNTGSQSEAYTIQTMLMLERGGMMRQAGYSSTVVPPAIAFQTVPIQRRLQLLPGDKLYVRVIHGITSSGNVTISNGIGESYLFISKV